MIRKHTFIHLFNISILFFVCPLAYSATTAQVVYDPLRCGYPYDYWEGYSATHTCSISGNSINCSFETEPSLLGGCHGEIGYSSATAAEALQDVWFTDDGYGNYVCAQSSSQFFCWLLDYDGLWEVNIPLVLTTSPDNDNDGYPDNLDPCDGDPVLGRPLYNHDNDSQCNDADPDDDNDAILDGNDNCPIVANQDQLDIDSDALGDVCDADKDNDGVSNYSDDCSAGEIGWTSDGSTDQDSDGCRDVTEDIDDDNDGVPDTVDEAPLTGTNSNEIDLDLNSDYKGQRLIQQ